MFSVRCFASITALALSFPAQGALCQDVQLAEVQQTATAETPALPEAPSSLLAEPSSSAGPSSSSARPVAFSPAPNAGAFAWDFRKGRKGDIPLQDEDHPPVEIRRVPNMFIQDIAHIAVSPMYIRTGDLKWMLPLAGAAVATFATDTKVMTTVVSTDPSFNNAAGNVSDALRDTYIAAPVLVFVGGTFTHNEHVRETGILGGQAMLDAYAVDEVIKLASFRERPLADNGRGEFYVSNAGANSSFVSGHAMIAWSSAAAMAGEYHNKWVQTALYTGAAGVSITRVLAQQHFPTDVLLGSAGGWLIGHYVYRAHHHAPHGKAAIAAQEILQHISPAPSM